MKKILEHNTTFTLTLLLTLLLFPGTANAANWHIRSGATGLNNGTNWADAWTSLPSTLGRGDTYYIADGTYGGYTFSDAESGTTYVYVKKATAADHGTDMGWNPGFGDGQALFSDTITFENSYYEFNGQYRNSDWTSGYGFKVDFEGKRGLFINRSGVGNITVKYVEIEGWTLTGNSCTRAVEFMSGYHDNLYIGYNYLHTIIGATLSTGGTNGAIIEYNYIGENGSNASCHGEAMAPNSETNFTVRYNIVKDTMGSGVIFFLSRGASHRQVNDNIQIYDNHIIGYRGDIDNGWVVASN